MRELDDVLTVIENTIIQKEEYLEWELKGEPFSPEVHCINAQLSVLKEVVEYARTVHYGWGRSNPELDGRYGGDSSDTESYSMYRELMND